MFKSYCVIPTRLRVLLLALVICVASCGKIVPDEQVEDPVETPGDKPETPSDKPEDPSEKPEDPSSGPVYDNAGAEVDVLWTVGTGTYPKWVRDSLITATQGEGTIRYHMSHNVDRSASYLDVSTSNPRVMGPFEGDWWEFSTPVRAVPGDVLCLDVETRVSKGSMRYWNLEYLDGNEWVTTGHEEELTLGSGTKIRYSADYYPGGSGNEFNKVFHGTALYKHETDSIIFRLRCCSAIQASSGTVLTTPNGSSARLSDANFKQSPHLYRGESIPEVRGTVCGFVRTSTSGVGNVVVSDGFEFTTTDADGFYQLDSRKENGYVFISLPSGYELPVNGVIPQYFKPLRSPAGDMERVDFELIPCSNDKFRMYFLGDIHLANNTTTKDSDQYRTFAADISSMMTQHGGCQYLATLGDMSWDAYWYTRYFFYPDYLRLATEVLPEGTSIFHTIGNHDHDMNATGDWDTVLQYKRFLGPNFYSYNIGKVHFISTDNIDCTNAIPSMTVTGNRTYTCQITPQELEWIRKDLSYVPKDVPVIVTGHSTIMSINGSDPNSSKFSLKNAQDLIDCFNGRTVHFVTGHSHKLWNMDRLGYSPVKYFEHNAGAVCAAWWRTDVKCGMHLAVDGVPGGYKVFDFDGKNFTWFYKATGHDASDQMETYDLNECVLSADKYIPNCTNSTYKTNWANYTSYSASHAVNFQQKNVNKVLLHVWDYDPSWKIEVTEKETGKKLTATRIRSYSPLYLVGYVARCFNSNASTTDPYSCQNMFLVTASSADSTLEIKVTDRFGKVYAETMTRPRPFSLENY